MNKIIRIILFILIISGVGQSYAQQGLQIASLFQKYGKQKGVTVVELSKEMLETYEMTLYKSISFKDTEKFMPEIRRCLESDKNGPKRSKK